MLSILIASLALPASAAAYNGNAAAVWADSNIGSCGTSDSPCFCGGSCDCTAFISEAMHSGGGFPFAGTLFLDPTSDDHYWWSGSFHGSWMYTNSWSNAPDLYNFLYLHSPGGYGVGSYTGLATIANDLGSNGDVVFYDWTSNGSIDHANFQVTYGRDPDRGRTGSLVDAHSAGTANPYGYRYHAFWSLVDYNANAPYTSIWVVHVASGN